MAKQSIVPFGPQHPVLPEPIHLDLVLEELSNANETEQRSARQIKEKIDRLHMLNQFKTETIPGFRKD